MSRAAPLNIPVSAIRVGKRFRQVSPGRVANTKVSIEENGWFGAIVVRPTLDDGDGGFLLVAGAHRLAAMRALGEPTIPALVMTLTDDQALKIEIDENLVREDLTALERAESIAARLVLWRRLHPDRVVQSDGLATPKRGRPTNSANVAEFLDGAPIAMGFAAETAGDIGLSERSVRYALSVAKGLPADLRAQLHGTSIARKDGLLRQLAALGDRDEQAAVAAELISGRAKTVSDARAYAAGNAPSRPVQTPVDEAVKAFRAVWKPASPSARAAILHELAGSPLPKGWTVLEDARG